MSENYFYSSLTGQEIEDTLLGAVVCNSVQNLTTTEKAQARANIGAGEANTSFKIMGYFATMEDLQNALTALPEAGDAYGISVSPTPASEYLSPDGTQTQFTLSESPYYITVTDTGTSTVLTPGEDYTYIDGVVTFPSAPAAGTNSYLVEWDDPTAPYDIYVWDALANAWVDNGQLIAADIIDDTETSNVLTWSSTKISTELSGKADADIIDDNATAADTTWSSNTISSEITAITSLYLSDTITAFPKTISNAAITATMRVTCWNFGTPSAITSDVGWTTSAGEIVLTGALVTSGSTTVSLILEETR